MIKLLHHHWRRRWERFYHRNRWHLMLDLALVVIIIMLGSSVVALHFYQPNFSWQPWNYNKPSSPTIDLSNPPLEVTVSSPQLDFDNQKGALININLKNKGEIAISDIKIKPSLTSTIHQIERLEIMNNDSSFQSDGQQIVIEHLSPQETRDINFRLYFNLDSENRIIPLSGQIEYFVGRQAVQNFDDWLELRLASELTAQAFAYYNSPQGDQLGIGPIPPIVGIPTKYWIFWELKSLGDFQNLVMSAKLPIGVELNDNRSLLAGELKYNPDSRQLIWTISEVINQSDSYRVGFEVQLIPSIEQVGQIVPLNTNIKYYAQDALTKQEVEGSLIDVDTDLSQDRINRGQGRVIQ